MEDYCFLNGKIVPFSQARLRLDDLGVLRGYGVFDYLRTYGGKPILLSKNLARLRRSAEKLGLAIKYSDALLTEAVLTLIAKNGHKESSIRIVLTGGPSQDAMTPGEPTLYILVSEFTALPTKLYQLGVKLITHNYLRLVPEAKTLNYITAIKLLPQKKAAGAFEILYVYEGKILECTTSNFYIFKGNTLVTAKQDILSGVTREIVLELARNHFTVEERDISVSQLSEASESFITAANKKILPVIAIDDWKIATGKVGKNTQKLMKLFDEFVQANQK